MWKAGLSHVGRVCAATWFPPWPWVQAVAAARVHGDFCAGPGAVRPWVPARSPLPGITAPPPAPTPSLLFLSVGCPLGSVCLSDAL